MQQECTCLINRFFSFFKKILVDALPNTFEFTFHFNLSLMPYLAPFGGEYLISPTSCDTISNGGIITTSTSSNFGVLKKRCTPKKKFKRFSIDLNDQSENFPNCSLMCFV